MQIYMGDQVELSVLTQAFNRGFQDYRYAATFTPERMTKFLEVSGVRRENCAVLAAEGGQCGLGMALLALDGETAWCGGLAVAPQSRRGGWATRLMTTIEKQAVRLGAVQLDLEVLTDNLPAATLYARLGYRRIRELHIWERAAETLQSTATEAVHRSAGGLQLADVNYILRELSAWQMARPCWQRSPEFLMRQRAQMEGYLFTNAMGQPAGYVLMRKEDTPVDARSTESSRRRIMDIGLCPECAKSEAEKLFNALCRHFTNASLTLLNEPRESPLNASMSMTGFQITERQFEMRRRIG